jgi:protein SCO1
MQRGNRGARFAAACLYLGLCAGGIPAAHALDEQAALRTSQAALGRQIGAYELIDQEGRAIDLASLAGRPALVSFIYTSCAHTCPVITQRLAAAVDKARDVLGEDKFTVLTIGFDSPTDSPERMRDYGRRRHIDTRNWYFLSGTPETMQRLTREFGFVYYPAPHGFDHLAQVSVLDQNFRLRNHVYGDDYRPEAVVEPLRQILLGRTDTLAEPGALLERIRLFCTVYDPAMGRYAFDYSLLVVLLTGILCLGGTLYFVAANWRRVPGDGKTRPALKGAAK